MTTGVYKLYWDTNHLVYIGKSVNIDNRYRQHKSILLSGMGSKKLQWAYDTYGMPKIEILLECSECELDIQEIQYINLFSSIEKGLNTSEGGSYSYRAIGTDNPNAKYKEEDYFNVLYFLSEPGYSYREIEELTGVSKYVISHISSLESHNWLKDKYPELYSKVENIKNTIGRESAFMQGIFYPKLKSPSGEIFEVRHQTNFAKEYGLLQPKLCELLKGTRNKHKGWTRA